MCVHSDRYHFSYFALSKFECPMEFVGFFFSAKRKSVFFLSNVVTESEFKRINGYSSLPLTILSLSKISPVNWTNAKLFDAVICSMWLIGWRTLECLLQKTFLFSAQNRKWAQFVWVLCVGVRTCTAYDFYYYSLFVVICCLFEI